MLEVPKRRHPMTNEAFVGYPEDQVLAAFASRADAARAIDEVREAGVPGAALSVYSGEEGEEAIDSDGTGNGLTGVVMRGIQLLMSDRDRLSEYEETVQEGGVVVAVKAEDDDQKHAVAAVFRRNEGHHIRHYGTFAVEELNVDPSRLRKE